MANGPPKLSSTRLRFRPDRSSFDGFGRELRELPDRGCKTSWSLLFTWEAQLSWACEALIGESILYRQRAFVHCVKLCFLESTFADLNGFAEVLALSESRLSAPVSRGLSASYVIVLGT